MDDEPHLEPVSQSQSMAVDAHIRPNDQYTGAFFPNAQYFVIAGGKFESITNITHVAAPTVPSDFRTLPLGDLDLRNEMRLDEATGFVNRRHRTRHSVKRMYSARIHGSKSKMTVAIYEGGRAEEDWEQDISRYSSLRHPNFVQIYGTSSSAGIYTTIFHDELIPISQVLETYGGSHFQTVYLWKYLNEEFHDIEQYMESVFGEELAARDCPIWIRRSTGRISVDLTPTGSNSVWMYSSDFDSRSLPAPTPFDLPEDSKIGDSISWDHYYQICIACLAHQRQISISEDVPVQLGMVISCAGADPEIEDWMELGCVPEPDVYDGGWWLRQCGQVVMENGWTRLDSSVIEDRRGLPGGGLSFTARQGWLAQASHVFNRLGITSNYQDYAVVFGITHVVTLWGPSNNPPPGYLFLCPVRDLYSGIPPQFRRPACPMYWSLDPTGVERLSMENAAQLGFRRLHFTMRALVSSWDTDVYTGFRQFQEARGHDPDSQSFALEIGYPLFECSSEFGGVFAHVQEMGEEDVSEKDDRPLSSDDAVLEDSGPGPSLGRRNFYPVDDTELPEPSRTWKIVMAVQFSLILALSLSCACDFYFRARSYSIYPAAVQL